MRSPNVVIGVTSVSVSGQIGSCSIVESSSRADSASTMKTTRIAPLTGPPARILPSDVSFSHRASVGKTTC